MPREDHAVAACRFAQQCVLKMETITRELELELGPGTGELTVRFGMHSGPVTGGGKRSKTHDLLEILSFVMFLTLSSFSFSQKLHSIERRKE